MPFRRTYLRAVGALAAGGLVAGCSGAPANDGQEETTTATPTATATITPTRTSTPDEGVTYVAVGPEGRLRFVPDTVEISVGDTVRWEALSAGHNVTSHPGASPKCENPEGVEPFTSYEDEQHFAIMDVGEIYEHTFTVPGTYVYVCAPHAGQGMVGTVTVSE